MRNHIQNIQELWETPTTYYYKHVILLTEILLKYVLYTVADVCMFKNSSSSIYFFNFIKRWKSAKDHQGCCCWIMFFFYPFDTAFIGI